MRTKVYQRCLDDMSISLRQVMSSFAIIISCLIIPLLLSSQCPNDNVFWQDIGAPPCGSSGSINVGGGTYVTVDVVSGNTYTFSTCNSSFNTQLTGYQSGSSNDVFYNDDNGPDCSGQTASVQWTSNFTGTLRVVVDSFNCQSTSTSSAVLEYRQSVNMNISTNVTNASCEGVNDGQISVSASGGNSPYEYSINNSPFQSSGTFDNLSDQTYTIIVRDNAGCRDTTSATVNNDYVVDLAVDSLQNVSCANESDGLFTVNASGGTSPYQYTIDGFNFQSSPTFDSLSQDTYTVLVEDAAGCQTDTMLNVNAPPPLSASVDSFQNADCAGTPSGSIYTSVSGGTPPYSYSWANSSDTTGNRDSLQAGTYMATVEDANGCTSVVSQTINEPPKLFLYLEQKRNVSCANGEDGVINVAISGGTPGYDFMWSSGDTTEDATGLEAGTHTITVTDDNGCTIVDSFSLTEPQPLVSNITDSTDVSCYGQSDGGAQLDVNGGTPPYNYMWSNFSSSANLNNVPAGNYQVVITDSLGCTTTDSVTISEPSEIEISGTPINTTCPNAKDGGINITVSGGVSPYSYNWSSGQTTQNINGIGTGTYIVTVTDADGCTNTYKDLVAASGAKPSAGFSREEGCVNTPVQFTNSSSIQNGSLQYFWDFGDQTSSTLTNPTHIYDKPGDYTVRLIAVSGKGCADTVSRTITINPLPTAEISVEDTAICPEDSAVLSVPEQSNTSYNWSNGATSSTITVNEEGTYSVTVTDSVNCTNSDSVTITVFDSPVTEAGPDTTISKGFDVQLFASGGTDYRWDPAQWLSDSSSQTPVARPLDDIQYTVRITDENGCIGFDTVDLTVVEDFTLVIPNLITPNGDGYNDIWEIKNITLYDGCQVRIFNRWGTEVFSASEYQNDWDGTSEDGGDLSDGTYYYVIDCGDGTKVYKGSVSILK